MGKFLLLKAEYCTRYSIHTLDRLHIIKTLDNPIHIFFFFFTTNFKFSKKQRVTHGEVQNRFIKIKSLNRIIFSNNFENYLYPNNLLYYK